MESWTTNKLKLILILAYVVYISCMLVIPLSIIESRYDVIADEKMSLVQILLYIIFGFVGLLVFNKTIRNIRDCLFKFICEAIVAIVIVGFTIQMIDSFIEFIITSSEDIVKNLRLAQDTIFDVLIFVGIGLVIDTIAINMLQLEWDYRVKAKEKVEIEKRVRHVK